MARDGRVLDEVRAPTPHETGDVAGSATAAVLVEQIRELCERQGVSVADVSIGIGLPGLMRRDGRLAFAPNLNSASGANLGSLVGQSLSSSVVFCENDADCAALAEHEWGSGRGIDDFVMVTLGTGIGGGVSGPERIIFWFCMMRWFSWPITVIFQTKVIEVDSPMFS